MTEKGYPRVLAISCNPFAAGGSNGKVFSELFCDWPTDALAQFYVSNELPSFSVCRRYYRLTDNEAKNAFLGKKTYGRPLTGEEKEENRSASAKAGKPVSKNPLTRYLRDVIWNSGRWQSPAFYRWIDEFSPEVIVMMGGDSTFIPRIAIKLAKKRSIPLVIFNTENYYFKNYNYMKAKGHPFFSWLFRKGFKRTFRKLMKKSALEIYNSEYLRDLYQKEFKKPSEFIYQATSLTPYPKKSSFEGKFSYMGNLGVGRHRALMDIGEALQAISPDYFLDIYGRAPSPAVEKQLREGRGIRFHGLIPYSRVKERMEESDLLFHAETADEFYIKDLSAAFSTKISDSLLSGRPLVIYAHESLACTQYLLKNGCAHVITDKSTLVSRLKEITESEALRDQYVEKALAVGEMNHNAKKNCERMRTLLSSVLEKAR